MSFSREEAVKAATAAAAAAATCASTASSAATVVAAEIELASEFVMENGTGKR